MYDGGGGDGNTIAGGGGGGCILRRCTCRSGGVQGMSYWRGVRLVRGLQRRYRLLRQIDDFGKFVVFQLFEEFGTFAEKFSNKIYTCYTFEANYTNWKIISTTYVAHGV